MVQRGYPYNFQADIPFSIENTFLRCSGIYRTILIHTAMLPLSAMSAIFCAKGNQLIKILLPLLQIKLV